MMPALKALLPHLPRIDVSKGLMLFGFIFVVFGVTLAINRGGKMLCGIKPPPTGRRFPRSWSNCNSPASPRLAVQSNTFTLSVAGKYR